jgi:hypothetical protein
MSGQHVAASGEQREEKHHSSTAEQSIAFRSCRTNTLNRRKEEAYKQRRIPNTSTAPFDLACIAFVVVLYRGLQPFALCILLRFLAPRWRI